MRNFNCWVQGRDLKTILLSSERDIKCAQEFITMSRMLIARWYVTCSLSPPIQCYSMWAKGIKSHFHSRLYLLVLIAFSCWSMKLASLTRYVVCHTTEHRCWIQIEFLKRTHFEDCYCDFLTFSCFPSGMIRFLPRHRVYLFRFNRKTQICLAEIVIVHIERYSVKYFLMLK
jgi:hypothetical protein